MVHRTLARSWLLLLVTGLVACGGSDDDGGMRRPTDLGPADLQPADSGPALPPDQGPGGGDLGSPADLSPEGDLAPADAGPADLGPNPDGGGETPDLGAPDQGGADLADLGPAGDATVDGGGAPGPDAGPDGRDAGAGGEDAGEADAGTPPQPPSFCEGPTANLYDPLGSHELDTYPDDLHTVADPTTATGLRLALGPATMPTLADLHSTLYQALFPALSDLDGFGTSAGGFLRFSAPLDPDSLPSVAMSAGLTSPVALVELGPAGPQRLPLDLSLVDGGRGLVFHPRQPLRPGTRHLLALTRAVRGRDGGCVAPSRVTKALLTGRVGGALARLVPRHAEALTALRALGVVHDAGDLTALTVFTTETTTDDAERVAAWIAARPVPVAEAVPPTCADDHARGYRRCTLTLDAATFLGPERTLALAANLDDSARYLLPVEVFLPLAAGEFGGPPYPTVLFGHGLGGDRHQAALLAKHLAPLGVATIAVDAVAHGDHPTRDPQVAEGDIVLDFFGIRPGEDSFAPLALRDAWQQSAFDKLQLIRRVVLGLDADADGSIDCDAGRLGYLGVSLGGIMGSEVLALAPELKIGVLSVPGARVTTIVQDASDFALLQDALRPPGIGDWDLARFYPLLQTVIERGDAVNYAPYVLDQHLVQRPLPPHLLVAMVQGDTVVSNSATGALARALQLPYLPNSAPFIDLGIEVGQATPVAGNLAQGQVTAGLIELDLQDDGPNLVPATHGGISTSRVGVETWTRFLLSWLRDAPPEIVDAYETLDLR